MSTESVPTGNTLRLPSSLRIADVGEFKPRCDAALETDGALDCIADEVEFIDAAGLQLVVVLARACAQRGRAFDLRAPSAAFTAAALVGGFAPLVNLPGA